MSKCFSSSQEMREKLMQGIDILANNVGSTLGPKGRNVILKSKDKMPIVTKDGVTVAKFVDLEDPVMNAAAQIVKQASAKTNVEAGDGTTTSTVLTRSIFSAAIPYLDSNPEHAVDLKRGIDKAVAVVVEGLAESARPIRSKKDVEHIATVSANNDRSIGNLIATAVDKVGKNGSITIEEARSVDTTLDLVEGFRFDSGYAAAAFVTDERRGVVRYEDPLFLITDSRLDKVEQILPALELAARESRPFIIMAEEIEGQALAALIMNTVRGSMKVAAIKAPRYGEERRNIMDDMALATGAKFFRKSAGDSLTDVSLVDFGSARTVEVSKSMTTVVGGQGDHEAVSERIQTLKDDVEQSESIGEAQEAQERLTRLASGVAVIRVGAHTEIEMIEKKHRIEDALEAVRSAQAEGVIPGGGVVLFRLSRHLDVETDNKHQDAGVQILKQALSGPLATMSENAGMNFPEVRSKIVEADDVNIGVDFSTGDLVDFMDRGVIDPVKVTRCALQNAASVAGTLITTNFAIIE